MHYKEDKHFKAARQTIVWDEEHVQDLLNEVMQKIDRIINDRKISYSDLSEMTGISVSYLYRIIKGKHAKVSMVQVYKLIKALDLDPDIMIPSELKKRKEKEEYGESFEYIVSSLPSADKKLLLRWAELYAVHQEEIKFTFHKKGKEDQDG